MDQLDGACESKSSVSSNSSRRRRTTNICCISAPPKPQFQADYDHPNPNSERSSSSSSSNAEPMRILSPRETIAKPGIRRYTIRTSSQIQRMPTSNQLEVIVIDEEDRSLSARSEPSTEANTLNTGIESGRQSLPREQSSTWRVIPSTTGSPTKEEALHSHPVTKEDLEFVENFVTPAEDGASLSEGYIGRY